MVTRKGDYHHAYLIHAALCCGRYRSACPGLAVKAAPGLSISVPQLLAGALVVPAGLPEFIKPIPFPVPLGLTIGLLLPDLFVRRGLNLSLIHI